MKNYRTKIDILIPVLKLVYPFDIVTISHYEIAENVGVLAGI